MAGDLNPVPLPYDTAVVDANRRMTLDWVNYLTRSVSQPLSNTARVLYRTTRTGEAATINAAPFPTAALASGSYRASYFAKVTIPASVNSSLTVSIGFTTDSVPCTLADTAITGNATNTVGGRSWVIDVDAASPVTYTATYASTGTPMIYQLTVLLEAL